MIFIILEVTIKLEIMLFFLLIFTLECDLI